MAGRFFGGLDLYLVGALAVAVGTSAPEIATAVAALIHPIAANFTEALVGLGFGAAVTVLVYPGPKGVMKRRRGAVLILLWIAFVLAQLQARGAT